VIEEEAHRLHEVLGVGPKRVKIISKAWEEQRQIKEVMLFLQSHNVSTGLAVKIYKAYGDNSIEIVKSDPYRLAREVYGIGFLTADKIARELGIAHDAPERVAAGVAYVLSQAADEGNVYLPAEELAKQASELLEVAAEQAMQGIGTLAEAEEVRVEGGAPPRQAPGRSPVPPALAPASTAGNGETPVNASTLRRGPVAPPAPTQQPSNPVLAEERAVYLTPFYYGEIGVANRLRRLAAANEDDLQVFQNFDWPAAFAALQANTTLALTAQQQEAVQAALTHRLAVLTGGPGTGKTTTVRSLIRLVETAGKRALLASPTGRAAKRLAEASGRQAKTIHRLLEYKPGEGVSFQRNEENPLETDIIIVDEASMLDLLLTNNLLKAIPAGAHLLLVGDVDQLPSVGAGNVLRDVIEAIEGEQGNGSPAGVSGAAVVRLNTIFRQPEGSYIITNAHRINHGQMPVIDNQKAHDFFLFKEEDPERAAALMVELVGERIPRKFGLTPDQIQVLSPMHRGEVGVAQLNLKLQAAINPPGPAIAERQVGGRTFRVGDRVMQIRNNYDKDVYNGDMGRLEKIDLEDQIVTVRIDDRPIGYDFLELDELAHSYAVSIHKAQGSEFPAVVIHLLTTHYVMLQRNLLYTAVTRAQRLVVIVGTPRAMSIAVTSNRVQERYSGLAERLEAENKATHTRRPQVVL
jgi:exodeoxyribonuclease V alpha subunit